MSIDFTSGERRGLIALLIILTLVLVASLCRLNCSPTHQVAMPAAPDSIVANATVIADSATTEKSRETKSKRKKQKKSTNKSQRPDGRQRSFLDEPVGTL